MTATGSISLPPESFERVFPFHWAVDENLQIVQFGRSLGQICPGIQPGDSLQDHLRLVRPARELGYAGLLADPGTLVLLEAVSSGVLLRGQILKLDRCEQAVFLGSPWFTEPAAVTRAGLSFDDFAIHDAVMDLLQVVQAERIANADIKKLAEKLEAKKQKLADQNEKLLQSEARLQEQQDELRKLALVASRTRDAVVVTDAGGYVEWVNEGFVRMTGYTLEEMRGRKPGPLLQGPDTDATVVASMHENRVNGEGFHTEIINYTKDREPYWLAIEVQPVFDEKGELTNFIAIERNITQAKQNAQDLVNAKEAAERANRIKSEFLANMSHEIRTPLNAVIGLASLLEHSTLDPKQKNHVLRIRHSGNALLSILNDILDFSKIEAGKLLLDPVRFDLGALVSDCVSAFVPVAEAKGLRLDSILPETLKGHFTGDAARIRQVLFNFLSNAIKFTDRGQVCTRLEPDPSRADSVRISVEDSGIGIPALMHEKIFEAFQQADTSTTRKYGGTGLGLAISRRLVQMMGGEIGFESDPGQGSRFWFALPLPRTRAGHARLPTYAPSESAMPPPLPRLAPELDSPEDLNSLHVLVVEDTEINRDLAVEMLARLSCRAEVAVNGLEALEYIKASAYDLVFMDCQMPEMDGYTATRELRRMELVGELGSGRKPLHIIAMTANAMRGDRERCLAAGMDDYVSKPTRLEDVQAALNRWRDGNTTRQAGDAGDQDLHPDCVEVLDQLCREIDRDAVIGLVTSFLEDARPMAQALLERGAQRDLEAVRNQAHALKGIAGSFGLTELAELTRDLEHFVEDGDSGGTAAGLEQLMAVMERASRQLQDYLDASGGPAPAGTPDAGT